MFALAILTACSGSGGGRAPAEPEPGRIALFVTTEIFGQLEPCGCTSDPLGDIARWAALVGEARKAGGPVLYVDGGSTSFTSPRPAAAQMAQEQLKADLLARAMSGPLEAAAIGLGPNDLAEGPAKVRLPRMAANVSAEAGVALAPPKVVEAGGARVGLFGVVAPAALARLGVTAGDPVAAAKAAVADLEQKGAAVVIGVAHMTKGEAKDLARAVPGIDFLVVGQNAPDMIGRKVSSAPDRAGDTWLIEPASKGQVISRIDLTVRPGDGVSDAIGPGRIEAFEAEAGRLAEQLATWKGKPDADAEFLAGKERELADLRARVAALRTKPVEVPASGSYFTLTQVTIKKGLPCDAELVAAKAALEKQVGEVNLAAAAGQTPPAPAAGKAGYSGIGECEMCHAEATAFWKKTRHAGAWETLEKLGKQVNLDCVSCHLVGWQQPGGANLAHREAFVDVQCEACHGPGSLHVDSGGERRETLTRAPVEKVCLTCHSPDHSDTFQFEAYLRDVVGEGHGAARRKSLGDGPTGRELRAAALEKAGRSIGKGCPK